jgi:phosphoribosylanthranilate isomerase
MNGLIRDFIQIAGIIDQEETKMLVECGVNYLGFPLRIKVHKEELSEDDALHIISSLRPSSNAVLITYLNIAKEIYTFCRKLGTSIVQLHGKITLEELCQLRTIAPELGIIKSLIVRGDNLAELKMAINDFSPYVDAFIIDTFDPTTGACGATGKTHDWSISRKLVEVSSRPVILAGGLNPNNVRKAILKVRPAGVDSHTGVEGKDGRKSRELVEAFVSESRIAFNLLKSLPI